MIGQGKNENQPSERIIRSRLSTLKPILSCCLFRLLSVKEYKYSALSFIIPYTIKTGINNPDKRRLKSVADEDKKLGTMREVIEFLYLFGLTLLSI